MKVFVLGGGVSGLTSAWSLARNNPNLKVIVLESRSALGGWIQSVNSPTGGVHEVGPRSMRFRYKAGKMALALMSELGLDSKIIPIGPNHKAANRRLIYTERHGLVDLPSSLWGILRPQSPFTSQLRSSIIKEPFVKSKSMVGSDESVHDFFVRRFGTEIAEWLIDPMCRGIYAGSSRHLSLQSTFAILSNYERQHGSVIRGGILSKSEPSGVEDNPLVIRGKQEKWQIYALQGGLRTLVEALEIATEKAGVEICRSTEVKGIEFEGKKVKITTNSNVETGDYIVSTLPSNVLAPILPGQCTELSDALKSIPFVSVGVVNLEYKGQVLPDQYREAFGYLVPSHQNSKVLGVVFDSSTFPELDTKEHSSTRLTVMMGGQWFKELFGNPDSVTGESLVEAALQSVSDQTGMSSIDPNHYYVNILKNCIPQYTLGHNERTDKIQGYIRSQGLPLTVLGSSYNGVSVNDCIMNSLNISIP